MEWLVDNWYWVVGAIFLFILFRRATRSQKKPVVTQVRRNPTGRTLTKGEAEAAVAVIISKLTNALEQVVDDAVGRHYSRADRQKIAVGMIAVMTAEKIPLERLTNNPKLFAAVMLKSIASLTESGYISTR